MCHQRHRRAWVVQRNIQQHAAVSVVSRDRTRQLHYRELT
jgi:hypothetical protein